MKNKQFASIKILLLVLIISGIGVTSFSKKNQKCFELLPPGTTLDSLQGKWINTEDSLNQVIISGRNWNETYNDATQLINENNRIFFSDTIVSVEDFRQAKIDTTTLSGNYIIRVAMSDYSMDCNVIDGFYQDQSDTLFSIEPAIKRGTLSSLVFKKTN